MSVYLPANTPMPGVPDPTTPTIYYTPPDSSITSTTSPSYSNSPTPRVINAAWAKSLHQTSWRGTIFYTNNIEFATNRKLVAHEYPFSDDPDIEDLGRGMRRVTIDAYLVGDDYANQSNAFLVQVELSGPGELIHPAVGTMQANCKSTSISFSKDDGRVVILKMEFWIPSQSSPTVTQTQTAPDTQQDTLDDSDSLDDASNEDFFVDITPDMVAGNSVIGDIGNTIISGLNTGFDYVSQVADSVQGVIQDNAYIVSTVVGTVMTTANIAVGLVNDAARSISYIKGLGNILGSDYYFGRYDSSDLTQQPVVLQGIKFTGSPNDITNQASLLLITQSANTRAAVLVSANTVPLLAEALKDQASCKALTTGICNLFEALRQATLSPIDGIRLLIPLCGFQAVSTSTMIVATTAVIRRAAISSLARSLTTYRPNTTEDVQNMFSSIMPIFDSEIEYSADANDQQSYAALTKLKNSVIICLQSTKVNLPSIQVVNFQKSLPSLVVAYQIYADSSQSDSIIALNDVINPAFMPLSIEVLSR
jgi:prophage DNA circulation protein